MDQAQHLAGQVAQQLTIMTSNGAQVESSCELVYAQLRKQGATPKVARSIVSLGLVEFFDANAGKSPKKAKQARVAVLRFAGKGKLRR